MANQKPIIGITMGDPAGIGPEIVVKALCDDRVTEWCNPVLVGDLSVIRKAAAEQNVPKNIKSIDNIRKAEFDRNTITVYSLDLIDLDKLEMGKISPMAGEAAFQCVKTVIELALAKEIDATVTAPINKKSVNVAGHKFSGHTEMYAHFTQTKNYAMLLIDENFRVVHVSTHVSLRKACDAVKKQRIVQVTELLNNACKQFGVIKPRIGIAALNPHAGDGNLFGDEDTREILPAVERAKELGIDAEGPFPADTLFAAAKAGAFDGCVAMYHDQGHIPFKLAAFQWDQATGKIKSVTGVNITLGLPIIRTSVDHGTAFEIAGQGIASKDALVLAIKYAVSMSDRKFRKGWKQIMMTVIADDFTGAAEIAGLGLRYGLAVEIEPHVHRISESDLLIIATDTRSMKAENAYNEVYSITKQLTELGRGLTFKKTDSIFRGHIYKELQAVLNADVYDKVLLVPANPSLGRILKEGIYYIKNRYLHETKLADDPDYPLTTSNVLELINADDLNTVHVLALGQNIIRQGIIIGEALYEQRSERLGFQG
ncbi:MAG: 4-hydroxythreonine-4-phosphate dehydrogenase PdxA [candidate division KSB1 bacterium]|nr:4-hydroxythreonine-4-phosphate dehydrogenase PdxA [candidate division KSB1 bacterium]